MKGQIAGQNRNQKDKKRRTKLRANRRQIKGQGQKTKDRTEDREGKNKGQTMPARQDKNRDTRKKKYHTSQQAGMDPSPSENHQPCSEQHNNNNNTRPVDTLFCLTFDHKCQHSVDLCESQSHDKSINLLDSWVVSPIWNVPSGTCDIK
jgi:hypothetical protein